MAHGDMEFLFECSAKYIFNENELIDHIFTHKIMIDLLYQLIMIFLSVENPYVTLQFIFNKYVYT